MKTAGVEPTHTHYVSLCGPTLSNVPGAQGAREARGRREVMQPVRSHKVYIHRSYPNPRTSHFKCIRSAGDSKCISVSCNGRKEQSTASWMGYEIEHEEGWSKIGSRRRVVKDRLAKKGGRRSAREDVVRSCIRRVELAWILCMHEFSRVYDNYLRSNFKGIKIEDSLNCRPV